MTQVREIKRTVWAWDFQIALGVGVAVAIASLSSEVRASGQTMLIAEAAVGAGFLATVLAALAVFVTFFDRAYRRVLEEAHDDLRTALMPYATVAYVAAATAVAGIFFAAVYPGLPPAAEGALLAIATALTTWTVAGGASLVEITIFHARQRAKVMGLIEQAREAQARTRSPARTRTPR